MNFILKTGGFRNYSTATDMFVHYGNAYVLSAVVHVSREC